MLSTSWTDERVERLKRLWADGLSCSQIAGELGGVTRNAVIGKVTRLELPQRGRVAGVKRQRRTYVTRKAPRLLPRLPLSSAEAKMPEPPAIEAPPALMLSLFELTDRTCKWPFGDPCAEDFGFCGHAAEEGLPYCRHHCGIAYQAVPPRRRKDGHFDLLVRSSGAWR